LLNRDAQTSRKIQARWADLGISGEQVVRDLWKGRELGAFSGQYETQVEPHEVVVVKMTPKSKHP
ncbi:MAG: hypothetical protein WCQ21_30960, partial [Verrucomicrobiota bacterium]